MAVERPLRVRAAPYSDADAGAATASALRLPERLVDADLDRHRLARPAIAGAAQGSRAQIIEADGAPHMGVGGAEAIRRVEADPAELGHEGLGPSVAGVLLDHAVAAMEIAPHIARRDAEAARRCDEDMREILAHAALERERLRRTGRHLGGVRVVGHLLVQPLEH